MYKVDFEKPIHVYFMGIGGISMSGLAEILLQEGFTVSGSDMKESEITEILKNLGARIFIGQKAENISDDIDLVVYTAAIHADNPEFVEVKRRNIPMLTRAQLLGQIMLNYKYGVAVSGTHGKTTTTSMLSYVLLEAQTDPTISIGGMLDAIGGNIRVGHSDYFVTEACEYTNSYHAFHPYISIILNVDADHLDFFSGIEEIADSFKTFAEILPDDGLLVVNGDMKYYEHVTKDLHCNIITFGMNAGNDYSATDITFDEEGHPTYTLVVKGEKQDQIKLHATGIHNVMNSLSVIAVADFLGIDRKYTIAGLARCSSAHRRFEHKGITENGVKIVDDYAHHPTEIAATLAAAKNTPHNELWCIFQPHTYSRTKALLDEFGQALATCDHVLLADIYAAREQDTGLVSSKDVCDKINANGGKVISCATQEVIYTKAIPNRYAKILYEFAKERHIGMVTYKDNQVITGTDTDGYMEFEARLNHMELCQVDDFLKVVDFDMIKCLMTAEPEVAEQYEKELAALVSPDLNVFRSEPYFIEITVKGVDKAESIARLLEHIDMKREQCICCGDGFNDKTMVEYAGVGVAMGNAQQVVKDVADYVTASCDEDGLVEVIKKFVL